MDYRFFPTIHTALDKLPAQRDYEFAAGYCVEMYDNAGKYPGGTADEN